MLWWDWREETKGWVPLYSNHPMSCVSSSDHRRNLRSTTPVPCVHLYLLIPLELHQNQWWWDNYKRANINDISLNETWTAGSAVGVRWIRFPSFCQPRIHCWGPHCRPLPSRSRSKSHHQKARTRATGPLIESLPLSSPPTWSAGMVAYSSTPLTASDFDVLILLQFCINSKVIW